MSSDTPKTPNAPEGDAPDVRLDDMPDPLDPLDPLDYDEDGPDLPNTGCGCGCGAPSALECTGGMHHAGPEHDDAEAAFSHMTEDGSVTMVDVGAKAPTQRTAIVRAVVEVNENTLHLLKHRALPKGDVLTTAKIAGIMAAKRTADLIPMCHPLAISYADVRFVVVDAPPSIELEAEVRTTGQTGVEMEAMVAAQVAGLTIYDMCKAVQKDIVLRDCRLVFKSGGKSGTFRAE
ncbi:cyclic pyranopterin monophosphate synthase MoaC [Nitratidesulfovibrio sp.]|uniref:cyclic pyranopterin monophosphate synthase MoaC n=1 Tax=Nitratidesulfovibrio sp. TaxID=2802297 RepID=UPI003342A612